MELVFCLSFLSVLCVFYKTLWFYKQPFTHSVSLLITCSFQYVLVLGTVLWDAIVIY